MMLIQENPQKSTFQQAKISSRSNRKKINLKPMHPTLQELRKKEDLQPEIQYQLRSLELAKGVSPALKPSLTQRQKHPLKFNSREKKPLTPNKLVITVDKICKNSQNCFQIKAPQACNRIAILNNRTERNQDHRKFSSQHCRSRSNQNFSTKKNESIKNAIGVSRSLIKFQHGRTKSELFSPQKEGFRGSYLKTPKNTNIFQKSVLKVPTQNLDIQKLQKYLQEKVVIKIEDYSEEIQESYPFKILERMRASQSRQTNSENKNYSDKMTMEDSSKNISTEENSYLEKSKMFKSDMSLLHVGSVLTLPDSSERNIKEDILQKVKKSQWASFPTTLSETSFQKE